MRPYRFWFPLQIAVVAIVCASFFGLGHLLRGYRERPIQESLAELRSELTRQSDLLSRYRDDAAAVHDSKDAITRISNVIIDVTRSLFELRELVATIDARVRMTASTVESVESPDGQQEGAHTPDPRQSSQRRTELAKLFADTILDPIQLPDPVERALGNFSASMVSQDGVEQFIDKLIQHELIPFRARSDISSETYESIHGLYSFHQTAMAQLLWRQLVEKDKLVESANRSSDFIELPEGDPVKMQQAQLELGARGSGVSASVNVPGERVRVYHFAYSDHPGLLTYFDHCDNALKHLLRDVYLLNAR